MYDAGLDQKVLCFVSYPLLRLNPWTAYERMCGMSVRAVTQNWFLGLFPLLRCGKRLGEPNSVEHLVYQTPGPVQMEALKVRKHRAWAALAVAFRA